MIVEKNKSPKTGKTYFNFVVDKNLVKLSKNGKYYLFSIREDYLISTGNNVSIPAGKFNFETIEVKSINK